MKQETQTWRQWEAEERWWWGLLHAWGVHVCGVCALGGARALAAPPCSSPVLQESWGRERKLTGDSAIPVIPDEIAARRLACQEIGVEWPGRGRERLKKV